MENPENQHMIGMQFAFPKSEFLANPAAVTARIAVEIARVVQLIKSEPSSEEIGGIEEDLLAKLGYGVDTPAPTPKLAQGFLIKNRSHYCFVAGDKIYAILHRCSEKLLKHGRITPCESDLESGRIFERYD